MKTGRDSPSAMVRMPPDLKKWLHHKAVDNHRSLSGEILDRLEKSRAQELLREEQGKANA